MSTLATPALSNYIAQQVINGQGVTFDEIIFCYIPDLSAENLAAHLDMPTSNQIVHRQAVSQVGFVNENAVVYSVTVGTEIGDFDFNYIALINRNLNLLGVAVYTNTIKKIKNKNSIQGNAITRSILLEFANAKQITNITIPAQTWQIDFTARLSGIDEKIRLTNRDLYGRSIFFDDGFLLSHKTGNQFSIHAGTAYIEGVRAYMENAQDITLSLPCKVYLDVVHHGTVTGAYQTEIQFLKQEKEDYVDRAGHQHYVQVLADIASNGEVTDRRELNKKYIPTSAKSDATDSNSSDTVATSKAVKEVKELAESKQSPADTLAGYGITDFQVKTGSDDVDNYKTDGHYYFASGLNLPDSKNQKQDSEATSSAWHVEVVSGGQATAVRQIARKANDTSVKTRFFNGSQWTAWKAVGGDGVPLGAIVAFPTQVRSPQGFLLCDGSTFEQDTYPDLYRTLGNSNKLPDLTKSDVGMLAYFPFDQIPAGWLPCNGDGITKADHPELFERLKEKYGTYQSGNTEYARLPNAEDRFIRNADNGLTVGQKQAGTLTGFDSTLGWHSVFGPYIKEIKGTLKDTADQVGSDLVKNTEDYNAGIAWSNNRSEENDLNKANKNPTTDAHFIGVMRPHSIAFKLCIKVKSNFDQIRFFIKAYGVVTNIGTLNAGNLASEIHEMRHSYVSKARLKKVKKKILRISNGIQGETIWRGKTSDPVVCKTKNKGGVIYVLFNIKSKEVITKLHGFHSITRKETITKGYGIHEDRWLSFPLLYADGTVIGDTDTGGDAGDYNYNTVIGIQTKAVKTEYGIYTGETEITITPLIDKDIGSWKDSWRDRTAVIKEVIALGGEEFNQEHPTESESTIDDF